MIGRENTPASIGSQWKRVLRCHEAGEDFAGAGEGAAAVHGGVVVHEGQIASLPGRSKVQSSARALAADILDPAVNRR